MKGRTVGSLEEIKGQKQPRIIGPWLYRDHVSVVAVGATAPTLFSERLFCTHINPLKPVKSQEFHLKSMDFAFLHPQFSISYMIPDIWIRSAI